MALFDKWTLVSVGRDKVINQWDLRDGSLITTIPTFEDLESVQVFPISQKKYKIFNFIEIISISRSKKKKLVATGGSRGVIRVWDFDADNYEIASQACLPTSTYTKNEDNTSGIDCNKNSILMKKLGTGIDYMFYSKRENESGLIFVVVMSDQTILYYGLTSIPLIQEKMFIGWNDEILDLAPIQSINVFLIFRCN